MEREQRPIAEIIFGSDHYVSDSAADAQVTVDDMLAWLDHEVGTEGYELNRYLAGDEWFVHLFGGMGRCKGSKSLQVAVEAAVRAVAALDAGDKSVLGEPMGVEDFITEVRKHWEAGRD